MTRSTALVVEPPKTLAALCAGAQVIAKGTVVWILRNEHTPINSPYAPQHTVYIFAVEQYLKSTSKSGPAVLKVIVPGGQLPYIEVTGAPGGIGWELEESPMLDIGSRYCLFLDRPQDSSPTFQRLGFVPAGAHNRYGKHAELDEYRVREMWRGKLLLRDGIARPARLTGVPLYDAWRFESGPQILNVPEDEAIRNIREAVTSE